MKFIRTTERHTLKLDVLLTQDNNIILVAHFDSRLGSVYMVRLIFSGTSIIDWEGNLLIGVIRYDWSPVTY